MALYVPGLTMPRDCPMCKFAHYNVLGQFSGCNLLGGKYKYAMRSVPGYAESNCRPDWCPLVEVGPHGRLIDADAFAAYLTTGLLYAALGMGSVDPSLKRIVDALVADLADAETVIPAEKEEV